jgi:hypothetical protein
MSNASIAGRLIEVADAVLGSCEPVSAFARAVELYAPAFEAVPRAWLDRLDALSLKAMDEDVSLLEEELLGLQHSDFSLKEARRMLEQLCAEAQQALGGDA